ncbi:hypothetical protein EUBDOL_01352 [Amedibacillus dolichus DSM 3991]|uniref:Uncharacterized protein n=1 Tax=Amedibacillus dolichus DSM 3991 TaxID=428127 RepID=A8RCD1_9FIRM|nr:hypothetical protein EUBDOL_01352 [Amedibacillus dolichus DSM 3991]
MLSYSIFINQKNKEIIVLAVLMEDNVLKKHANQNADK